MFVMNLKIKILTGLLSSFKTTRNFYTAISLRNSNEKKRIVFRNGLTMDLSWAEYWRVREVVSSGFNVERLGDDMFKITKGSITVVGSSDMLRAVVQSEGFYEDLDYAGKTILDVGGFQGESAVFFSARGAKKVIIYEPVHSHQEIIKKNVKINNIIAELHEEGIGAVDSVETIEYESESLGFGLGHGWSNRTQIKIRNIADVINESNVDVAKFNCEGAEENLVSVPTEVLRKVKTYIIMPHGQEIGKMLNKKFQEAGFELTKKNKDRSFLCFERKKEKK